MSDSSQTQQERVYQKLKTAMIEGAFMPGSAVSLRGVAKWMDVSPMPVREALRRLTTEQALELKANRRFAIPEMPRAKVQEVCQARIALETQAALRALPAIGGAEIAHLQQINYDRANAVAEENHRNYLLNNFEFHRALYGYGQSRVIMPMIESLWLQLSPIMNTVLQQTNLAILPDWHAEIISALSHQNPTGLAYSIEMDITQGVSVVDAYLNEQDQLAHASAISNPEAANYNEFSV